MADGVNRIVPASVSLDRAPVLGRERERKDRGGDRKKTAETAAEPSAPVTVSTDAGEHTDGEKNKGKNLDIKA
jgi:hypothetical protein